MGAMVSILFELSNVLSDVFYIYYIILMCYLTKVNAILYDGAV